MSRRLGGQIRATIVIKKKTVFILGAGAHVPYGFPDGRDLIKKIIDLMPKQGNANTPFSLAAFRLHNKQHGVTSALMAEFGESLQMTGHSSIDSFLATFSQRRGFPEIGKLAVAYVLLPLEFKTLFVRDSIQQDWMSYLFEYMFHGCTHSADDFIKNNDVSFVSFNYDRTLEYFLSVRLASTYGLELGQAGELVKNIPIVHVYGSLGTFATTVLYTPEPGIINTRLKEAVMSMRLMYEDRDGESTIQQAKRLISAADNICFLGFGFDPDNITRLELNERCNRPGRILLATRYKVADGDWGRTQLNMAPTSLDPSGLVSRMWDSLAFLHETRALG
jgi:hypothetical protein